MLDIFSINIYISRSGRTIVKLYLRRLTGDPVSVFQYYIRSHIPTLSLGLHLVLVGCPAARTNVSRHLCLHIFLLVVTIPAPDSRDHDDWIRKYFLISPSPWQCSALSGEIILSARRAVILVRVKAELKLAGNVPGFIRPLTLITDARPSLWSDLGNADDDVFSSQLFNPGIF